MGAVIASIRPRRDASVSRPGVPRISSLPPEPDRPPALLAVFPAAHEAQALREAVEPVGCAPSFVASVSEFWGQVAKQPPDLVLIPGDLQEIPAQELFGEIRMRRSTRHIAVVAVLSTASDEEAVIRCLRAGADDCGALDRPLELRARIAVQLRNNRYRQMLRQVRNERDVLRVAATMDPLTRIPNRRALDRTLAERVESATRFGVLYLDIDHFKSINDQLGHDVGDEVLRKVAAYLGRGVRSNDFCGRYGGEEFLVIVDGADEELATKVGDRHRNAIGAITFGPRGPKHAVTVSIGVSAWDPASGRSIDEVLRAADRALYQAKGAGRNRVVCESALPDEVPIVPSQTELPPDETPKEDNSDEVEAALLVYLESRRAALPVLPDVATQALRVANDPNANLRRFAALVDKDPHIAARFISVANSVIYARGTKTTDINGAVIRVGLQGARDILFQVVYSASTVGLPRYQQAVSRSFARSVLAGTAMRRLTKMLGTPFPYDYLTGLLHDIGEARVYRILASLPTPPSAEHASELVRRHHCRAGVELAEAWSLPEEIVKACGRHHDLDDTSLAVRLVRIADAAVEQVTPLNGRTPAEPSETWFEAFGLRPDQARTLLEHLESTNGGMTTGEP